MGREIVSGYGTLEVQETTITLFEYHESKS